jgi:23S rRNA pseudoU1915 N3-methylase RlmH
MQINLLCIGKTDDKEISSLINYYLKRLPKHWNFEIIEIPDVKNAKIFLLIFLKGGSKAFYKPYRQNRFCDYS